MGRKDGVDVITQRKDGTIQNHNNFGNNPYLPNVWNIS